MTMTDDLGEKAYEVYRQWTHGVSLLVSNKTLLTWDELPQTARDAWLAAAQAIENATAASG